MPVINMASRTAVAQPRERVEIVPVLLTSERYRHSEADKVVLPEGAVRATLRQATLWYQNDEGFRNDIWTNRPAWTSQEGLRTDGFHEILQNGDFKKISEEAYYKLPPENRSYHWKGSGLVSVGYNCEYRDRGLIVYAGTRAGGVARVAYVQAQAGREAAAPVVDVRAVTGITPEELVALIRNAKDEIAILPLAHDAPNARALVEALRIRN